MATAQSKPTNAQPQPADERASLVAALASEADLAARAAEIRGDAVELDAALFLKLYPLLCEPIPSGFIKSVESGPGKPYDSTGIRSVQVQVDRMNNVLTPLWWSQEVKHEQEGKLCHYTVVVHGSNSVGFLVRRTATGGVGQGNTLGNIYKGSATNAGKRAFALLGPGHEVYVGAPDQDPDTDDDAAKAQTILPAPKDPDQGLTAQQRERVEAALAAVDEKTRNLILTAAGVEDGIVSTVGEAFKVRELLDERA
jgi:hypothetical protein